jgi:hypothetical protein
VDVLPRRPGLTAADRATPRPAAGTGRRGAPALGVAVLLAVLAAAVLSGLLVRARTGGAPVGPAVGADGLRNPLLWPYAADSIWNTPLGAAGRRVPLPVAPPTEQTLAVEEDLIVMSPSSPLRPVYQHDASWSGASRCGSGTGGVLAPAVPIPLGWHTDPGYVGATPNQAAAILMPDGSVLETQPLHVCSDGTVVSEYAPPAWRTGSLRSGGAGTPGAHGGSHLTALGGTIRVGEWAPGRRVIPHVLKIELPAAQYLSPADGGFRWPARAADHDSWRYYAGPSSEARMGSLLALPTDFDADSLQTEPARILARTLTDYGAYVVDDTARSAVAFATEWGPAGRVIDEFRDDWGFDLAGNLPDATGIQREFLEDVVRIYSRLQVVADNGPDDVGGAGPRLAPWAPPLEPG